MIGMGMVGGATAQVLGRIHKIHPYDKYKKDAEGKLKYNDLEGLKNSEVIFLCVPTPMKPSGEIDYSPIHNSLDFLKSLTEGKSKPLVIVKSTAVSGTTDKLAEKYPFMFAFNPEFLREKHALKDMENTDRVIIGANEPEVGKKVLEVYKPVFPNARYIIVDRKTAEMIKYAANVFLASQIAIANELYDVCNAVGVDYDLVKEAILLDERIGRNIDVPGPDRNRGFGGKCFPKDLNALIYLARERMYRPYLLEEVWRLNERVRKNKDWFDIPGATSMNSFGEEKQNDS